MKPRRQEPIRSRGLTLVEVLIALVLSALIMGAAAASVNFAVAASHAGRERNELAREASFAMERIVASVRDTRRLLVPRVEDPATGYREAVRAALAVALAPSLDRDGDGYADADNDHDGQADEDLSDDQTNDLQGGVIGLDDDGDGLVDESGLRDDDEDGLNDEDVENGVDDDGDGSRDEDAPEAMDGSGAFDDDSDGVDDEDWIDVVAYFVSGGELRERHPDLSPSDGTDFTESTLAQDVTQFRVERLPAALGDRAELVDITLTLTRASGANASQHARVRAGGGR